MCTSVLLPARLEPSWACPVQRLLFLLPSLSGHLVLGGSRLEQDLSMFPQEWAGDGRGGVDMILGTSGLYNQFMRKLLSFQVSANFVDSVMDKNHWELEFA